MVVIKEEMIDEVDDKVAAIEQVSISEFFYEPILLILNPKKKQKLKHFSNDRMTKRKKS